MFELFIFSVVNRYILLTDTLKTFTIIKTTVIIKISQNCILYNFQRQNKMDSTPPFCLCPVIRKYLVNFCVKTAIQISFTQDINLQ